MAHRIRSTSLTVGAEGGEQAAAAAAVRDLVDALVGHAGSNEDLAAVVAGSRELAQRLSAAPKRSRPDFRLDRLKADGTPLPTGGVPAFAGPVLALRPFLGAGNPFGVEALSRIEGDEAVTDLVLSVAFEGAPGRAHGGIVAAIFDDVTGHVLQVAGTPAFTGSIFVTYHRPTPLDAPLCFRARLSGREGRRLFISADVRCGAELIASCDAVYITVDPAVFSEGRARP